MSEPVFLPLMVEDQPDTAERVRLAVQSIEFAFPRIERIEYVGKPAFFRIKDEEAECP